MSNSVEIVTESIKTSGHSFTTNISQCSTAVRTVVRAIQQVNGKWPFSGCQNSVTHEPIDYKFDTRDYVGEMTSCAKFHKIRRLKG